MFPFIFDATDNFEIYYRSQGIAKSFTTEETISLKKSTFDCDENNSMKFENCVNDFIAEQLKCKLPWTNYLGLEEFEECDGKDRFEEFRNVSRDLGSELFRKQLKKRGCFTPNCAT